MENGQYDSEEIRTLASEENGALNHRLRPLGHTTVNFVSCIYLQMQLQRWLK
jgi:hypothetical protein